MQTEYILSGFGGQGIMFAGQILSYAAMDVGKQVTWIPSYGPEMRGGTANCTVIVADEEIGSPIVKNPDAALAMNLPSLDKYEPMLKPGGVLVVNETMVDRLPSRKDITYVMIPCNTLAEELGTPRLANVVALGALMTVLPVLSVDDLAAALRAHMPGRHQHLLPKNIEALNKGREYAQAHIVKPK